MTDVFTEQPSSVSNDAAPVNTTADQPQYDFIGEGKQYANPEAALSSIPHKDEHIARIEKENSEMREKLTQSSTINDVLSAVKSVEPTVQESAATPSDNPTDSLAMEDVVRTVLQEEQARTAAESNISQANKFMRDAYGDKASEMVKSRSQALGMDFSQMQEIAARSPEAFKALFPQEAAAPSRAVTEGDANTQAMQQLPQDGKARYDAIRKADVRQFMSKDVQLAQMKEAMQDPEKYFNG